MCVWLPIEKESDFKLASQCFKFLNGSGPQYLSELLHLYTPTQQLSSSDDACLQSHPSKRMLWTTLFFIPRPIYLEPAAKNHKTFSLFPLIHIISKNLSLYSFISSLKTYLFTHSYHLSKPLSFCGHYDFV